MKRCVIVAGGERAPIAPLREGDFLLACDSGLAYALDEGLRPDLILGDFDSYRGALPPGIPVLRYPVFKDDTDTMLAVRWAIAQGFEEIRLCCALGGNLDHLLANLQTLHFAAEAGLEAVADDARTELRVLRPGTIQIPKRAGWKLSIFALTDRVEGLCIRGAKYNVEDTALSNAFPLGVGNDFVDDVELSFRAGLAALLLCRRREE